MALSILALETECCYAEWDLGGMSFMFSVASKPFMLRVVMLNVVILSVIILKVMALYIEASKIYNGGI